MPIGIDLVEIERIRGLSEKWGDRFLKRVFSENEISYSFRHRDPWPHLAARFAAKEALVKALGKIYPLRDASIESDETGRPFFNFSLKLRTMVENQGLKSPEVSLSHTRSLAVAVVSFRRISE